MDNNKKEFKIMLTEDEAHNLLWLMANDEEMDMGVCETFIRGDITCF